MPNILFGYWWKFMEARGDERKEKRDAVPSF
jgi:hypothetical protein